MTTETGQREGNFVVAAAQDANIFPIDIFEEGHLGRHYGAFMRLQRSGAGLTL
jgi:hypothetical protein